MSVTIKSAKEIELMREAGRLLEIVHKELEEAIRPGISTMGTLTIWERRRFAALDASRIS